MLKSIFYKIMSDEQQRQTMNSLEDKNQIYKLFCQNGYTKSYDEFEKEMEIFLDSDDSKKLLNNDFGELSDEVLEMIAGGVNIKRAVTAGIATLLTTFTIGAVGSQITSVDATSSPTQVVATFDNSNEGTEQSKENNGGTTIKQTSNKQFNNTAKNKTFRFGQRKGPGGGGASVSATSNNGGGGGASISATNNNGGSGSSTENKVEKSEQSAKKTEAAKKLFNAISKQENKQNQQLKKDALNKLKDNTQKLKQQEKERIKQQISELKNKLEQRQSKLKKVKENVTKKTGGRDKQNKNIRAQFQQQNKIREEENQLKELEQQLSKLEGQQTNQNQQKN